MTHAHALRPRPATLRPALLAGAMGLVLATAGHARATGPTGPAGPDEADAYDPWTGLAVPPPGAPDAPPPYRDRLLAPADPEDDEDDLAEASSDGLPRALRIEAIATRNTFAGLRSTEFGVGAGGSWESRDHGTFSLDVLAFRADDDRDDRRWRGTATLWQRGLAMPGGWRVDNGLGVLGTQLPGFLRDQYRVFLPSVPLLGAGTEWRHAGRAQGFEVIAGVGGTWRGSRLSGFDPGDGNVVSAGGYWRQGAQWSGAAAVLVTDGRIVPGDQGLAQFQNGRTRALLFGQRWQDARASASLQVLASDSEGERANGAWLDGTWRVGGLLHRFGAFALQPDLAWGAFPIANDARGGYWRVEMQRARWSWHAGLDRVAAYTDAGFDGWYGTGGVRYQVSPRLAFGGTGSFRDGADGQAVALQAYADVRTRLGDTRYQVDGARDPDGVDSWQVLVDHALRLREGWRLSVSAGLGEQVQGDARLARTATLAAYGGADIGDRFAVDGTVRWSSVDGSGDTLDLNLGWRWQLRPRWSLFGNLTRTRGRRDEPFILDPLNPVPATRLPDDRSAQVGLRYDFSAGRAAPVLGAPPGAPAGRISGTVFLDDNGDGVRGAGEQPAVGVTIILDGRFVARTDDRGRFTFERVAVGQHRLEAVPDQLPLPWSLPDGTRTLQVDVRAESTVEFAAQRPR